jgi:hypothetical protein
VVQPESAFDELVGGEYGGKEGRGMAALSLGIRATAMLLAASTPLAAKLASAE